MVSASISWPSVEPSIPADSQSCVPQIEEKYKSITVKDESPALKRKINELTVVSGTTGALCPLGRSGAPVTPVF